MVLTTQVVYNCIRRKAESAEDEERNDQDSPPRGSDFAFDPSRWHRHMVNARQRLESGIERAEQKPLGDLEVLVAGPSPLSMPVQGQEQQQEQEAGFQQRVQIT